jgi:HSP20 family protein
MANIMRRRRGDWDPLDVFDEMRNTFESFFGSGPFGRTGWVPVDIRQEEDRYVVEADLPGCTEKDIDVRVDRDVLTISSKKEEKREEKDENYLLRERRQASFRRSFTIPADVDSEKIDAKFHNGQLTIDMPRSEKAKPRQIEVKKP